MNNEYIRLEDIYVPEGDSELGVRTETLEEAPELKSLEIAKNEILRIEENVPVYWSGVTGCCSQSRIDSNCDSAYKSWVQKKLYEYRHLRWVRYGHPAARISCSSGRLGWPNDERWCRARTTLECYIEFRKP